MTTSQLTALPLNASQRVMIQFLQTDNDNVISAAELAVRFGQPKPNKCHSRTLRSLVRLGLVRRNGSILNPTYSLI